MVSAFNAFGSLTHVLSSRENATSLDVAEQVQSGTIFALIDRLTSPLFRYEDLAFRNTFIETFPDFTTINDVFRLLRERFYANCGDDEDKKASAVHTRGYKHHQRDFGRA
ncbi:hypothetical protein BS47DRAFT_1143456 [Hydnum rufescens UP504]|uniref:N-terminal Ras-GEF domain-containing protein n=1 Tax=Hydnum rufescens UP504 TaxID=1448309 RepID=A0A9P6DUI1_9AGAM|nr:hypothetical protein BS47DRAFT_1143456 [Hydnum rufescens UP504]